MSTVVRAASSNLPSDLTQAFRALGDARVKAKEANEAVEAAEKAVGALIASFHVSFTANAKRLSEAFLASQVKVKP